MGRRTKIINGMIRKQKCHWKFLCLDCLKSGKGNPCGVQGHRYRMVSHKIHFPSPSASKTRWKEFLKAVNLYIGDEEDLKIFNETLKNMKGIIWTRSK
jgi:hypothetical protein